jgi:hypothetical protein
MDDTTYSDLWEKQRAGTTTEQEDQYLFNTSHQRRQRKIQKQREEIECIRLEQKAKFESYTVYQHDHSFNPSTTYHYTYMITNSLNDMFYYGVRGCKGSPLNDTKYMGSSKILTADIKRKGKHNYIKTIINIYDQRYPADTDETRLIQENYNYRNPLCYNMNSKTARPIDKETGGKGEIRTITQFSKEEIQRMESNRNQ